MCWPARGVCWPAELIRALPAAWGTAWPSICQERGKEDGLTLIPLCLSVCGSCGGVKPALPALTLRFSRVSRYARLCGGFSSSGFAPNPLITPPNWPNTINSHSSRSDPLAYLSSKWVKAQSSRLILLRSREISWVAFVCRSDN